MTDMTDPNAAFYELYNGRTRALRNVFGDLGSVHPNTTNKNLNKPRQRSTLFGYNPEIDKKLSGVNKKTGEYEYDFTYSGGMYVKDKADAYESQDIWMSNEVWENFERAPGGKRQARGFEYENYADQPITPETKAFNVDTGKRVYQGPASFNEENEDDVEIPTATENPERPRTVAAAFDNERSIITLVFRDGTVYNYYNCSRNLWNDFKRQTSKYDFIKRYLDKLPRGVADMSKVPEDIRIIAYGRARSEQVRLAKAGGWKPRTRARYYDISKAKANGKNPADYRMVRAKSRRNRGPI